MVLTDCTDKYAHLANQRMVFENFAKENNFDPLVPNNWHSHSTSKILAFPV